jgi:alanyl-tRNA synthetase
VVEFDFSPAVAPHVARTGAIGLIKVLGRERVTRAAWWSFSAARAVADYAWTHAALQSMAGRFSTLDREVDAAVARLEQDARDLRRRLKELDEARLDREAVELAAGAVSAGAFRLVRVRRAVESPEELKGLAGRLRLNVGLVELVAGTTPDGRAHLVLARSDDVPADMNEILRGILPLVEGKGGGRPEMAQGSGTAVARLDEALGQAVRALQRAESD